MRVTVKYNENLKNHLLKCGFSEEELERAALVVHKQFRSASHTLFLTTLHGFLPTSMEIHLMPSQHETSHGLSSYNLGGFLLDDSSFDHFRFVIREELIRLILEKGNKELVLCTALHELMHTADYPMIERCQSMLSELKFQILCFGDDEKTKTEGYRAVLKLLSCYREEGIALLGECLLANAKFDAVSDDLHVFRRIFVRTMRTASKTSWDDEDYEFVGWMERKVYTIAPDILVMVLAVRGDISADTAGKIFKGFKTGHYDLTQDEVRSIIKKSLALSLPYFLQGLLTINKMGQTPVPMKPFFDYAAVVDGVDNEERINAFVNLMHQPFYASAAFNETMEKLLEKPMTEAKLEEACKGRFIYPYYRLFYPDLHEKMQRLLEIMKTADDPEKRKTAQWALTYLFSENTLVSDELVYLERVDDMMVVDRALKVMEKQDLSALARFILSQNKK